MTKPTQRPALRLFWPETLVQNQAVELSQEQCHYLFKVMRRSPGDQVGLFNSESGEFVATLEPTGKRSGFARLGEQLTPPRMSNLAALSLYFAPIKRGPTELVIQKATELGVTRLCPIITKHTRGDNLRMDRLKNIAIEATEQCERLAPPTIMDAVPLQTVLNKWDMQTALLIAAEAGESQPLAQAAASLTTSQNVALFVGPEGGFSPEEFEMFSTQPKAQFVGLGPRILKAETAAISGLSIIQAICGDGDGRPNFRSMP